MIKMVSPAGLGIVIATAAVIVISCSQATNSNDNRSRSSDFAVVEAQFADPGGEFRPAPLWDWNTNVTTEDIDRMLKDFKDQGFGGAFVHPRPGLETEYLSDEWFRLWRYSVEKGRDLGLDIWIYDENSYPSGFAGGHMYREMPESSDHPTEFAIENGKVTFKCAEPRRFTGDVPYVDLIYPGTTEKFLEITMSGYEKEFGAELGKLTHGSFTDEPECPHWTTDFPKQFKADWGYDIMPHINELAYETGDWKATRFRYSYTRQRLFMERWGKVYGDWCENHGMLFTGHYWEHGWPGLGYTSDHVAMYNYHQMPAIDLLMNNFNDDDCGAQWGNVRAVKELRSAANQMGRVRTLCESYGAGGWDMTFEDMRRLADWEYALGVNFMNQHYSNITIEGARKFDHPDYFTGYSPWAEDYKVLNDHIARLSLALSQGNQRNDIVVLEPNPTLWMYYPSENGNPAINRETGLKFQRLITALEKAQIEYDIASEMTIKDFGKVKGSKFIIGECSYSTVIIPENTETLLGTTASLLRDFAAAGGKIVALAKPVLADAVCAPSLEELWKSASADISTSIDITRLQEGRRVKIEQEGFEGFRMQTFNEKGGLFHMTREYDGGTLLYLTNSYQDRTLSGKVTIRGKGIKKLDTMSGDISLLESTEGPDGTVCFNYSLPPCTDLMVFAPDDKKSLEGLKQAPKAPVSGWDTITAESCMEVRRMKDNYLLLDFCNLRVDGNFSKDLHVASACDRLYDAFGWKNPWNSTIQYKTLFTDISFDSGDITVEYPFVISEDFDWSGLKFVCEKPWLWEVAVNGEKVSPIEGEHPLDARNGAYEIGKLLRKGTNTATLHIDRMSIYAEISFAFISGDFSVVQEGDVWAIAAPRKISAGSWDKIGMPFYCWDVAYSSKYSISDPSSSYRLELGEWEGTECELFVNSEKVGIIFEQPYTYDLTGLLKEGENTVEVRCIGSLANLFGPHNRPRGGSMWPSMWNGIATRYPAADYVLDGYGLKEPFKIRKHS